MRLGSGGFRPRGIPIARALSIRSGIANDDLREAVAAIERVHGDGNLPDLPMSFGSVGREPPAPEADGRFSFDVAGGGTILPLAITIRFEAPHRQFVLVHEVGHLVDACGIPGVGFSSASFTADVLDGWRDAVVGSLAVKELRRLANSDDGRPADRAAYLVRPDELWARSYAQFVAIHCRSGVLLASLEALRRPPESGVYLPRHWSDDDFAEIDSAIAAVFRRLGWIGSPKT